jgi:hypothetical protein
VCQCHSARCGRLTSSLVKARTDDCFAAKCRQGETHPSAIDGRAHVVGLRKEAKRYISAVAPASSDSNAFRTNIGEGKRNSSRAMRISDRSRMACATSANNPARAGDALLPQVVALLVPEEVQELIARGWLERFFSDTPEHADCVAHLVEVRLTTSTAQQVRFEPNSLGWRKRVLQVVGNKLHEFLTGHVARSAHVKPGSRWGEMTTHALDRQHEQPWRVNCPHCKRQNVHVAVK